MLFAEAMDIEKKCYFMFLGLEISGKRVFHFPGHAGMSNVSISLVLCHYLCTRITN